MVARQDLGEGVLLYSHAILQLRRGISLYVVKLTSQNLHSCMYVGSMIGKIIYRISELWLNHRWSYIPVKVTGNALNIEYYFWWCDDCFGLLIHHDPQFHFMVSTSDEYKYKRLVKTTFKSCGKLIFLRLYHTRN